MTMMPSQLPLKTDALGSSFLNFMIQKILDHNVHLLQASSRSTLSIHVVLENATPSRKLRHKFGPAIRYLLHAAAALPSINNLFLPL